MTTISAREYCQDSVQHSTLIIKCDIENSEDLDKLAALNLRDFRSLHLTTYGFPLSVKAFAALSQVKDLVIEAHCIRDLEGFHCLEGLTLLDVPLSPELTDIRPYRIVKI